MPDMLPRLNTKEVASILRLSPRTVQSLAKRGLLPAQRAGRKVLRFSLSDIEQAMQTRQQLATSK